MTSSDLVTGIGKAVVTAFALAASALTLGQTPGVTDKEIVIGTTMPLTGPASGYANAGRSAAGYFKMLNDNGGINGRKINFIIRDDSYSPPKSLEQTRRLVEQDKVAFIALPGGSVPALTVRSYLNERKVPQLFVAAALEVFNDPKNFPWTTGSMPTSFVEGREIARNILRVNPKAKIAALVENSDNGRGYMKGLYEGLGPEITKTIREASFELSDPSVDSQILSLQASGADTLFVVAPPKATAQAIRKAYDAGWRPSQLYILSWSASVEGTLVPAGLERAKGVYSAVFMKDPTDPQWADDPGVKEWVASMNKYNPGVSMDALSRIGWLAAEMVSQVIRQCGNDLSRENVMRQAARIDMKSPLLLPGVEIKTSPTNFGPIQQTRMQRFDGERWALTAP